MATEQSTNLSKLSINTPPPSPNKTEPPSPRHAIPTSEGQYIVSRRKMPYREISPYDVKNVYRNVAEMNRAIKRGTFNVAKTQHMNWNDKNVFWLCYADDKQPVTALEPGPRSVPRMSKLMPLEEKIDEMEENI